jgi:D-glycero-beta-D-manno-heptose 1-phosphate adenylyltransferase
VTGVSSTGRVMTLAEAGRAVGRWRELGEKIVLANGIFDLLHVGHVRYLAGARALGTRLVVAVNGDRSAARLKGPGHPVMPAADRGRLVAALRGVDLVVVFDEPSVDRLLATLRPDVHAKGTDYARETVPERAAAAALGIETAITGDPKAHASRDLVARVRGRRAGSA